MESHTIDLKMSDIYEKARYSPYECTMEDDKKMKEVCKKGEKRL